jgi:hypothetical protein
MQPVGPDNMKLGVFQFGSGDLHPFTVLVIVQYDIMIVVPKLIHPESVRIVPGHHMHSVI